MVRSVICLVLATALALSGAASALASGIASLLPAAAPLPLPTVHTPPSAELAGADRVATAVRIAQEGWDASEYVVIATSANFPDALSGSPLAYALDAPLLLTPPSTLAPAVATEIEALGATRAVVLGGTGALSAAVVDGLVAVGIPRANVERIAGDDRYETARDIAARLRQTSGAPAGVVVASGTSYPDALAAAGFAARSNRPILLTVASSLPAPTRQALTAAGDPEALVVGGTAAVSEAVASKLTEPIRIGGADRYETAALVAEHAFTEGVMQYEEIVVATGESFPDALAAGPYAARTRATLVLTRTGSVPAATDAFARSHTSGTKRIVFLGGTAAITPGTRAAILEAATTRLAEGIRLADDPTEAELLSVAPDELVYDSATPLLDSLEPDQILIGEPSAVAPGGYLRRVVGVTEIGGDVIVQTEGVVIEELIEDGSLDVVAQITPDDIAAGEALVDGVTLVAASTAGVSAQADVCLGAFTLELDGIEVGPATLDGSITLEPGYQFHVSAKDFKLTSARFATTMKETAEVTLSGPPLAKEIELYKLKATPVKTMVGPVPVWVSATIKLFAGVDAGGSVDLRVGVEQSVAITSGLEYSSGSWRPVSEFEPSFKIITPTAADDIVVEVYAGAKAELKLYDLAGPYGEVKPFVEATFTIGGTPWWRARRAIDLTAGFVVEIDIDPGIEWLKWTWTIADVSKTWTVAEASLGQSTTPYEPPPTEPDTVAPVVNADVNPTYYESASITITASDPAPGSGVKDVSYVLDSGGTVTVPGASATVDVATLGDHTLRYWATDNEGNVSSPIDAEFEVVVLVDPLLPGTTERVSLASDGTQGNGNSEAPAISADGRLVAFHSSSKNLVLGDTNNAWDIFVRDRYTGVTTRVSVSSMGAQANGTSGAPSVSADGRFVAFHSTATNLVPGDTNGVSDVFVHDRLTGATSRVSLSSEGVQGNQGSGTPSISADGRFIAYSSYADNLAADDTNGCQDNFLYDRTTNTTVRVSVSSAGIQGDGASLDPAVNGDGSLVAFASAAGNLIDGDTNGVVDVFLHRVSSGETVRLSIADAEGDWADSGEPAIAADGGCVVFSTEDEYARRHVHVHDLGAGVTGPLGYDAGTGYTHSPHVSANGRYVSFIHANGLSWWDLAVVFDRSAGSSVIASKPLDEDYSFVYARSPVVSDDGRVAVFDSSDASLVDDDTNAYYDVFAYALTTP